MISIWEHMWQRIYTRLDDKCEDLYLDGNEPTKEQLRKLKHAGWRYDTLSAMLDEAHQLRDNVSRMDDPFQWKFNLKIPDEFKR